MIRGDGAREMLAWMSMYMSMEKLGIGRDPRVEARTIRMVNRDNPLVKSVSTGRVSSRMQGKSRTLRNAGTMATSPSSRPNVDQIVQAPVPNANIVSPKENFVKTSPKARRENN